MLISCDERRRYRVWNVLSEANKYEKHLIGRDYAHDWVIKWDHRRCFPSVTYFSCVWLLANMCVMMWCHGMCFHVVMLARSESRIRERNEFFCKRHENLWLHEAIVIGSDRSSRNIRAATLAFDEIVNFISSHRADQSRAIFSLRDHHQFREPRNECGIPFSIEL